MAILLENQLMPTHYRTCNLCEAMCGLEIQYEGRTVQSIKGDQKDSFSRGHICPKALGLKDIFEDPDRIKEPLRRTENGWEVISWEEAIDEVVSKLKEVQTKHGNDAVGAYLGNPNAHNIGSILFGRHFLKSLRSKNIFSATSADQLPHHFVSTLLFGHMMTIPIPDIDRTQFMLIIGANPLVSNGSMMSCPDYAKRLKAIQKRGGKVVVIDPRRTETARKADQYVPIQPGKDVFLLLAMLRIIIRDNAIQLSHLEPILKKVELVKEVISSYALEKLVALSGIPKETIESLTKAFTEASSAVCYGRLGVSTQEYGGLCQWLIYLLNTLTGNMDRAGGTMFTQPAFGQLNSGKSTRMNRWKSRVRGLHEFAGELPNVVMAEEMLTEGQGQIKAMITMAGNPVLSTANGKQLEIAFEGLDFMVSIDIYINETTKYADIILPSTTGLEVDHYDLIFHQLAIRNTVRYCKPLFERESNQRHDWEILKALTKKMTGNEKEDPMTPAMIIDYSLQNGPYGKDGLSLKQLEDYPHGKDLGALNPCLLDRLTTKDQKIDLAPTLLINDLKRLDIYFNENQDTNKAFPLSLIGRRHLRSNNSWMHNSQRLVKGRERCTVLIHPNDAKRFNIENNKTVTVTSQKGSIELPAEISDEMMEGVLSIPHGWGHAREGVQQSIATAHAGVSVNDLTDETYIDTLTGNTSFSGVAVCIAPKSNYTPINCSVYDEYERIAVQRKTILLMVMDDMMITQIEGKIKTLETKNKVEYMILESGERIRLDDIVSWTEV